MPSSLAKHRRAAFARQNGRCHYCGFPMWLEDPAELSAAFGLSDRESARLQCTAQQTVGGAQQRRQRPAERLRVHPIQ